MGGRVQSVERAMAILQVLAVESEPTSLAQLAASLDLAKPTVHGLVQTLRDLGFVDQDPDTGLYSLGPAVVELGQRKVDLNEVRSRALNWTDALAAHSGEAAQVGVFSGGRVLIAHHVFRPDSGARYDGSGVQRIETGATHPLHATALGKVLVAYDPRAARWIGQQELESFTYRTMTDRSRLLRDLADVRDLGWAAAVEEEHPGEAAIAAPVRDGAGHVIAAIGIHGSVDAICDSRQRPRTALATKVVGAARRISREFGHGRAA
ncbi:MAG: IclR family transcriptional regulator [Nocardioidaceae bacterium]